MSDLRIEHDGGPAVSVHCGPVQLLRYIHEPTDAQRESPRPYFHPMRTLGGDEVTLYRPHDHVWHKGLSLSLPNVGPENFWGGPTYLREGGYQQLPNNGTMRHRAFDRIHLHAGVASVREELSWVTESGRTWFTEQRAWRVHADPGADAWVLAFATRFVNVSDGPVVIGSPTTEGRPNAGYGGLFWRGPRSFTEGSVHVPGVAGGDDLMGVRAPWMAFTGTHDDHGRVSTVVMVDDPANPAHPTKWFVRSTPFACLCPAPFFDTELALDPGGAVSLRYAVVIADGGADRAPAWARAGAATLEEWR